MGTSSFVDFKGFLWYLTFMLNFLNLYFKSLFIFAGDLPHQYQDEVFLFASRK